MHTPRIGNTSGAAICASLTCAVFVAFGCADSPKGSAAGTGGGATGGILSTGGAVTGGAVTGGAFGTGGSITGGASSTGGSVTGGVPGTGGSASGGGPDGGSVDATTPGDGSGPSDAGVAFPRSGDPGTAPWVPVPPEQVADVCHLEPAVLKTIDYSVPWLVVRYGKLCWAGGGALTDAAAPNFSATKTLGAATLGMVAYDTRNIPRTGRKTGSILDTDRADFWLDFFTYNKDALIGHVLGMEAQNTDLSYGHKKQVYDTIGTTQINTLSTVMNTAIAQDPARLGANLDAYAKQRVFGRLGMKDSTWDTADLSGLTGWHSTVGDMARLGLLLLHGGMWSGERLLDSSWVYKMTHPSFEDGNTAYGYLTWLNARNNWNLAGLEGFTGGKIGPAEEATQLIRCAPAAINAKYPHPPSDAPNCNYAAPATCSQQYDVGSWEANGLGGQLIIGHPGLDMVIVTRNFGTPTGEGLITMGAALWQALVPAIVALDPRSKGDQNGFCAAYESGSYAPDLR